MITVTWRDLVGSDYGPGMDQPVDLTHLRAPAICTMCRTMGVLLTRGVALGGPSPDQPSQFYGKGAVTAHNVGAAIDIFYHRDNDAKRAFANALVELFIRYRASVGWGWMAYNRVEFNQRGVGVPDDPHLNHIHVDWVDGQKTVRSRTLGSFTYNDGLGLKTKTVGSYGQDIAMTTNPAADRAAPGDFAAAYEALCSGWSAETAKRYQGYTTSNFDAAYAGLAAGSDLSWLLGWWEVWDGNYYYYYFDHGGRVVYIETKPRSAATPAPAAPHNKGSYTFNASGALVISWNALPGLAATIETFYNAKSGALLMNATSNQYSPLVATRLR
ncbi:MAG: hypothetical protein NEA02_15910 [Thermoanaerobaculia bacterium]|nr:hypothetical protein [Thermoanaerobaculia bacterium]